MNANEPDESVIPAAEPAAEAPPKPRRRRSPKAAAEAGAEAAPADAAPAPVAEAAVEAPPAKPARSRSRKRVAAEPAPEAAAGDTPGDQASLVATPAAPEPVVPAAPAASVAAAAAAAEVDAGPAAQPAADGESGEGGDAAKAADGEAREPREGSRRSRNRRRRRGERRERAEGEAARPGEQTAEGGDGDEAAEGAEAAAPAPALPPGNPDELFAEVLSGAYDQEPVADEADAAPAKRVLAPDLDAPKLHKVLAQSGIGSRRDMEQWMQEGRVTVNGEVAHTGQRISFGDRIAVDGKPVKVRIAPPPPRVLAYHKPAGEVVTHDDPQHRPTVFRRLPRLQHGKWQSVGRLDINTEGLLLFTNSGDLANQLMHPRFGVEREYAVRSLGVLDEAQRARLLEGVEIEGQRCAFVSIADGGGEGANHWYRVVITEGRNREVRKLFDAVGHAVSRLIRIRYGCVVLPRGLRRGVCVDLGDADVRALRQLTGTDRPRGPAGGDEEGGGRNKRSRRGGRNRSDRGGERGPRPDRGNRAERGERADRPPREAREPREHRDDGDGPMNIPNPLQQTYDKRAIQQARSARRELSEDDPIPNPLQQTYDKRALQQARSTRRELSEDDPIPNPLQQTYDKRFVQGGGKGTGGGGRGRSRPGGGGGGGGGRQPDPMQTTMGFLGADALRRKGGGKGGRGGQGGGNRGGQGGGGNRGGGGGSGGRGRGGRGR